MIAIINKHVLFKGAQGYMCCDPSHIFLWTLKNKMNPKKQELSAELLNET